jgi:hypothetical protein
MSYTTTLLDPNSYYHRRWTRPPAPAQGAAQGGRGSWLSPHRRGKAFVMTNSHLAVAAYRYDNTRALLDGSVTIDGVDAAFTTTAIVSEIFERMIRGREFDVSELGWTYYLRTLDLEDPAFIALAVFPKPSVSALGYLRQSRQRDHRAAGLGRQDRRRVRDVRS